MPVAPSVSTFTKFGIGSAASFASNAKAYEWLGDLTFGKRGTVMSTDGIRGTRSHPVERTRNGLFTVGGTWSTNPGPADLTTLLPYILGTSGALTESIGEFYVGIEKIAAVYQYAGCKMASASFSGSQGSFLALSCNIEGKTETVGAITGFSALTPSLETPYVFMDCVLTIGGTPYQFREFNLTIDNGVLLDRFMNSTSRTDLIAADRVVAISLSLPFTSDTLALYDTGATSAAVVLTFTNGANSLTMTMPAVQFPAQPQNLPNRNEIILPLSGIARKTGATLELTVANV